jgi:hypothetical protein
LDVPVLDLNNTEEVVVFLERRFFNELLACPFQSRRNFPHLIPMRSLLTKSGHLKCGFLTSKATIPDLNKTYYVFEMRKQPKSHYGTVAPRAVALHSRSDIAAQDSRMLDVRSWSESGIPSRGRSQPVEREGVK